MKHHKKLTSTERERLAAWKQEGLSNSTCAKRLGRHVSTIGRELKRNTGKVRIQKWKDWEYIYEPIHAHAIAMERKCNAWFAKEPLKNKKIFGYVMEKLHDGWSPEQIAGRLKNVDHPDDPSWHICHETIYQYIYKEKSEYTKLGMHQNYQKDKRKNTGVSIITVTDHIQPLWEYLRRKQKKRRKRGGRKVQRVRIPDRVSIHERPKEIDKRNVFGHWEGDSIVGKGHTNGIHTEYERVSSYLRFEPMKRIDTHSFVHAAETIFGALPKHARKTCTLDNGSEHTDHKEVTDSCGVQFYFADPYCACQRGGNENGNLWIRYYFPKGTDFGTISSEELHDVEWEINNRPRKRLNFKTPQEVFDTNLTILP